MNRRKRVLRITSVLAAAFAAGHLAETLRSIPAAAPTEIAAVAQTGGQPERAVGLPVSASLASGTGELAEVRAITSLSATATDLPSTGCDVSLALAAAPSAMIDLALVAPCNRAERVIIRHAGLSFTARTGPDGNATLSLPALATEAVVTVYLERSGVALGRVTVPDAADHTRFAFQWTTPGMFDLRANEGGQLFTGSGNPADSPARKILSLGAATVQKPYFAEIYTYPPGEETVDLTVELRITPETCGRTLMAETIFSRAGKAEVTKMPVAVPLCGTAGDILVLKNLAPAPTLAAP